MTSEELWELGCDNHIDPITDPDAFYEKCRQPGRVCRLSMKEWPGCCLMWEDAPGQTVRHDERRPKHSNPGPSPATGSYAPNTRAAVLAETKPVEGTSDT